MKFLAKSMDGLSRDAGLEISDLRVAAVLVFVILNLAVFLLRLVSVWRYGALFPFDSVLPIYAVWKGVHHLQVYEWPLAYPFSLAPYNYLFYYTYVFFLRSVGATGAGIMTWGRLLTPVFVIVGAIAQWKLVQHHLNLRGAQSAFSLFFAVGLWSCTSIVRHWALCIRPDMGAIALVMVALYVVVRRPRFGFVYAGVLFYLAWSFKQSVVLAFVGVCLFLLFHKRWRDLSVLATIFAVLIAATLLLGTPEYRYDTLVATRLYGFSVMYALRIVPKSVVSNAYWILAPIALLFATGGRRVDNTARMLIIVLAVALPCGLAAITKIGGWDNYILEAFVAGSTLLQLAVFTAPGRLVSALVMYGCIIPSIQLATAPSGPHLHTFGTVGIATPDEYADAVALRDRLAPMKKPIFSTNTMFSLPWFSNDNRAPALIIDYGFHNGTRARCQNGCVEGMLQRGEIPTVVLESSGDIFQSSLSPKYKKVGEARESDRMWSIYEFTPQAQNPDPSIRQ
ncbi:MAG: hypothetical protein WCA89_12535 [Terracidiphilus sp.]|jgi:hypothetical protein